MSQENSEEIETKDDKNDIKSKDSEIEIFFVIDTTASMTNYIASLSEVLDQIFGMITILFGGNVSIHIISYKDYYSNLGKGCSFTAQHYCFHQQCLDRQS